MRSTDTPASAGHQLDLQDLPPAHVVQGLPDDHLLTTALMEQGSQSEAERIQRSLDMGLRPSGELFATKSSPEHCFTGYNFKHGQDMMVQAALSGVSIDQQVELVPVQVVPSQALTVGQGMVTMDGMPVAGSYRLAELEGQSGYPLQRSQSQGQQYAGQAQRFMTGSENSIRQLCQTPTRVDALGRPTKVLVQHRGGAGSQAGLQMHRQVSRVSRTLSDSDIVLDSSLSGALGAGALGHHVLRGMGSVVQACGRGGTPPMADGGDRCGGSAGGKEAARTRWKPNPVQLCLLEQHFNSGDALEAKGGAESNVPTAGRRVLSTNKRAMPKR